MPSSITSLINQACGLPPNYQHPVMIIFCPMCAAEKVCERDDTDPKSAAYIGYPCHACLGLTRLGALTKALNSSANPAPDYPRYYTALGVEVSLE